MVLIKKLVSRNRFEQLRQDNLVEADVLYVVTSKDGSRVFGWSPDGEGFFFYGSMAEFRAAGHL